MRNGRCPVIPASVLRRGLFRSGGFSGFGSLRFRFGGRCFRFGGRCSGSAACASVRRPVLQVRRPVFPLQLL
ncbi:MAG: hypothetical protein MZV64_04080 [Ignavibacteriales bacterium]|nr:hypothetical protein [Ignavibacteriales bacterium]